MQKRNAIIIINPTAGKGNFRDILPLLEEKMNAAGWRYEIAIPQNRDETRQAAKSSFEKGFDTIVAAGGDGTVHDIVKGINLEKQSLGIIPLGSGNDIFRMLKIKIDPVAAIDNLINGDDWKIDVGIINGKRFLNTAGIGIDSETLIVRRETKGFVKRNYVLLFLKTLSRLKPVHIRITADGTVIDDEFMWVIACNNNYIGGGMLIAPNAIHDDGLLDLILIRKMSKFKMVYCIPSIFKGSFVNMREVTEIRASEITFETDTPCEMGVDGDLPVKTPATISILPRALSLIKS
ncbi:diacylglycerol kinase family lipid kinase [bacterium]|nr:diacylglycerol kinase family lipid kinase [bacterium]